MNLFRSKQPKDYPSFSSGRDAFKWAFQFYIDNGETPPDAAIKAKEFSAIICEGLGLPQSFEPDKKGFDLYNQYCIDYTGRPIQDWAKEYWPAILAAISAGFGSLVGVKVEEEHQEHLNEKSIYDQVQDDGATV